MMDISTLVRVPELCGSDGLGISFKTGLMRSLLLVCSLCTLCHALRAVAVDVDVAVCYERLQCYLNSGNLVRELSALWSAVTLSMLLSF